MGQNKSNTLNHQQQLTKTYIIDSKNKEENITFLTHRETGKQQILREITYNEQSQYEDMLKKITQRKQFKSDHLTNLIRQEHFKEENLCSNVFKIYSLWEYPRRNLAEEINSRALERRPFTETQLRTLMQDVSSGLAIMQSNRNCHQCLTTKSILIEQPLSARVVDPITFPTSSNLDLVYSKRNIKSVYLSPQQCRMIQNHDFSKMTQDPIREDVFTFGIIMLQSSLLERQDQCYNDECEGVNWKVINLKLDKVGKTYSLDFKSIIQALLKEKTQQRPDWRDLTSILNNKVRKESIPYKQSVYRERRVSTEQSQPPITTMNPMRISAQPIRQEVIYNPQPRNSFQFTYKNMNPNQPIIPITTAKYNYVQPPILTLNNVVPKGIIPTYPQKIIFNSTNQYIIKREFPINIKQNPFTQVNIPSNYQQGQRQESKFTPITINYKDQKNQTNETTNQQRTLFKKVINNQFKINTPTLLDNSTSPPQPIPNFQLHINEPVFAIDQLSEGRKYEGYKINGQRNGQGKFFINNELCFDGNWKNNLMDGEGKMYYQTGKLAYEGHFDKDRFHGYGKIYNQHPQPLKTEFNYENFQQIQQYWISYQGYFEADLKEGKGTLYLTNGQHFQGNFMKDSVWGEGIYTTLTNQKINGVWCQNHLDHILQ